MGTLTLSMAQGEGLWLMQEGKPSERWVIDEVFLSRGFILKGPDGRLLQVHPDDEVEIAEEVWVSDGHRLIVGRARIVLNAPKKVTILRDELYEERKRREAA